MKSRNEKLLHCVELALRPIMRFCLRHSLRLQDIIECCKRALVDAAVAEIRSRDSAVSVSRINVMTGVHRPDVMRIYRQEKTPKSSVNQVTRVIGQWQHNPRFQTPSGKPRTLSVEGKQSEFSGLVLSVSGDLNPYTVLFELLRIGAAEKTRSGLRLRSSMYISANDLEQGFQFFSRDSEYLLRAIEENTLEKKEVPNLHVTTEYDRVVMSALPEIRSWLYKEGSAFHARARSFLSKFDKDTNSALERNEPEGAVALGTFGCTTTETRTNSKQEEAENV